MPRPLTMLAALAVSYAACVAPAALAEPRAAGPKAPKPAAHYAPVRPRAPTAPAPMPPEAIAYLKARLERAWNPGCKAPGADTIVVKVRILLSPNGRLLGPPEVVARTGDADEAVLDAAAARAVSAVARGAPYAELPAAHYARWRNIVFNFNGRSACAG